MRATNLLLIVSAVGLAGCDDDPVVVRDVFPPAAPRGVYTVTGDHQVFIYWLENTETDVAGYRIYEAPCATGRDCPYEPVGTTEGASFRVGGLTNGVTRYFGVTAYDRSGNESELSREILFDTPRPEGIDRILLNYLDSEAGSGYDFSASAIRRWDDLSTDMFFGYNGTVYQMFVPSDTDIQDAGYGRDLDAVDFAPSGGWSPSGTVELIESHCYVVWTGDNHFAKFRVTDLRAAEPGVPARVVFDWAYQTDGGNRELRARPVRQRGAPAVSFLR
ncbi:MAG TPA: hypothetical protein VGK93_04015 [Candidatus Eisenbacteria bacterium]|jgi:hypothetical protein